MRHRRSRPRRRPYKGEREVRPSCRNWLRSSVRLESLCSTTIPACTAVAAPSVRSRFFVFTGPSASMAGRGCRASCSRFADSCITYLLILSICSFHSCLISRNASSSVVVVVFLTLTDPLRIQPWSQDRRNQTKSNRESEVSRESQQKRTDKKVASKGHRRDEIENTNKNTQTVETT